MTGIPQILIAESMIPPVNLEGKGQKLLILQISKIRENPLHKVSQKDIESYLNKIS